MDLILWRHAEAEDGSPASRKLTKRGRDHAKRVAATLLSGAQADWHMAKGAVWWLRHVDGEARLFTAIHPKLA